MKNIIAILGLLFTTYSLVFSQDETALIKSEHDRFYEEYSVLKSDSTIKQGKYFRLYRGDIIEKGEYYNNHKVGKWRYFSLDAIFQYEYNYDTRSFVKIAGKNTAQDYLETPVCFNGSPIVPYLYMVRNVRYPIEAKKHDVRGRSQLTININKKGEITSFYVSKKLHPLMDKEIIRVAKTFPDSWTWIPATYEGQNTDGQYTIDIEFDITP